MARSEGTSRSPRLQSAKVDTVIWPVQAFVEEAIDRAGKEARGRPLRIIRSQCRRRGGARRAEGLSSEGAGRVPQDQNLQGDLGRGAASSGQKEVVKGRLG